MFPAHAMSTAMSISHASMSTSSGDTEDGKSTGSSLGPSTLMLAFIKPWNRQNSMIIVISRDDDRMIRSPWLPPLGLQGQRVEATFGECSDLREHKELANYQASH